MRGGWAEAWGRQLKPGGQLVTLMFPVDASRPRDEGPPFPLTPELYNDLLSPLGEWKGLFHGQCTGCTAAISAHCASFVQL